MENRLSSGQFRQRTRMHVNADKAVSFVPHRFQEVWTDTERRADYEKAYADLQTQWFGRFNKFASDKPVAQAYFEPNPAGWYLAVPRQLELLGIRYPTLKIAPAVLEGAMDTPAVVGKHRLIVMKHESYAGLKGQSNWVSCIGELIQQAANEVAATDKLYKNRFDGVLTTGKQVRYYEPCIEIRKNIEAQVPGDYLVVDADLGNRYCGWSSRSSREDIILDAPTGVFSLSGLDAQHFLMIHPNRFTEVFDMAIDWVSEEYCWTDGWSSTFYTYFGDQQHRHFSLRWAHRPGSRFGAAFASLVGVPRTS